LSTREVRYYGLNVPNTYRAAPDILAGFKEPTSKGKAERRGKKRGERRRKMEERGGVEGKGKKVEGK